MEIRQGGCANIKLNVGFAVIDFRKYGMYTI